MLGHLIRKEILDQILGLRFVILTAIGAMVIWLSLYDGYAYYRDRIEDYRLAQATTEARVQQLQVADDWGEFHNVGYLIHKLPATTSIFIRGLEPTLGRLYPVWGGSARRVKRSPAAAEPILGVFPALDLGLVVQVVLSLFVLLLTYDTVCGEKEGGTLRLMASFALPRHRLLLGKLIGTVLPLLAAFGLPLLLGVGIVLLMPQVHLAGVEMLRLGLILVACLLYLVVFACAGLLTSCLTQRAATSFVLLLAFWVVAVAVLPRLSLITADGIRPAPSVHGLQAQKAAVGAEAANWRQEQLRKWREARAKESGPEGSQGAGAREALQLYFSELRQQIRDRVDAKLARLDEAFRNRYRARLDLAILLGRLSPAFALNNATVCLAETGMDRHRRFADATDFYYREAYRTWMARTKNRDRMRGANPKKYGEYKWDVSDMPGFTYQWVWPETSAQTALVDMGVMLVWAVMLFAGAYVAILRYDLR